ncbi:MAG: hypothetical protein U0791_11860 [Gemmataceae bacterium]
MRFALLPLILTCAGCASVKAGASPAAAEPVARAAAPSAVRAEAGAVRALEASLRSILLKNLPDPIVKSEQNWGKQRPALVRKNEMRNDGTWRRFSVRAPNPQQSLGLGIEDAVFPEPGRATFTAKLGVDCDLQFEQQIWKNGLRLYSGETRGRCRAAVLLQCEAVSRTETKPGAFVPDLVFRVKVTEAKLFYDDLVIEHTAGVGGDAAKILGDAVIDTVKQAKPELEKELLDKANAAIVKAADTRDVRLSFDSLLRGSK